MNTETTPQTYRIVFAGTPDFAAESLKALIASRHNVVAVYTQPDRPSGRGQQIIECAVKKIAAEHQIPIEQPLNFKETNELKRLEEYQADLMIVAAYGIILPLSVLHTPKIACLNIHASLLPRWRGAAPIQRAILENDKKTGITIMLMAEGLDTGDMLLRREIDIQDNDTGSSLHDRLAHVGQSAILECLDSLCVLLKQCCPQDDGLTSYAKKLTKSEANIDWSQKAETIHNTIRAFNSWPVCHSTLNSKNIRIWKSSFSNCKHSFQAGEICSHDNKLIGVACTDGIVFLEKIQMPGKKALASHEILNSKKDFFAVGKAFEH